MAQKASDMESLRGYGFSIIWKGIWYVISEFIYYCFDTFTNETEQIQIGTFPSFHHKSCLEWQEVDSLVRENNGMNNEYRTMQNDDWFDFRWLAW
jgi:hypothetical protein